MYCKTPRGLCKTCYGNDLMKHSMVSIGTPVGVVAAQSIGEPGTQLTMRTFHSGGVASKDITSGLPRVEELFEARTPKYLALMAEINGTVKVITNGDNRKIIIMGQGTEGDIAKEYLLDPIDELLVKDGDIVAKGDKITAGNLDLDLLRAVSGDSKTKAYIINEVQSVYASQGVNVNDKHIEVIVSQMFKHVRIVESGDTKFLSKGNEIVTLDSFNEENTSIDAQGGEVAKAKSLLLGIKKAALYSDSFLSAASFIQTSQVLTDAAASGKVDPLFGLKENVILGRLIPTEKVAKKANEQLNKEEK
jgi:DNA-directed RNA polymerase subunit beta'